MADASVVVAREKSSASGVRPPAVSLLRAATPLAALRSVIYLLILLVASASAATAQCPSGTFWKNVSQTATVCENCASGKFNPLESHDQTSCFVCKLPKDGSDYSSKTCVKCKAGKAGVNGTCTACIVNTITNKTGSTACTTCAPGHYGGDGGRSVCKKCVEGRFTPTNKYGNCEYCAAPKYIDVTKIGKPGSPCRSCSSGKYQDSSYKTACKDCPTSRYSTQKNSKSVTNCRACISGRFSTDSGRTSPCMMAENGGCVRLDSSNLGENVVVAKVSSLFTSTIPNESVALISTTNRSFLGNQMLLVCRTEGNDDLVPERGANVVTCSEGGGWQPDPRVNMNGTINPNPTVCLTQVCKDGNLPRASFAQVETSAKTCSAEKDLPCARQEKGSIVADLVNKVAPFSAILQCDSSAIMLVDSVAQPRGFTKSVTCSATSPTKDDKLALQWLSTNDTIIDFTKIKCQCGQGFKQGTGRAKTDCVQCKGGTYAPINSL